MKFGFVTCVQLGLSCMEAIYRLGGKLEFVITLHDEKARAKSGRVYIDGFCKIRNIPLLKVDHINDSTAIEAIRQLDWLFIIGWSQIASPEALRAPTKGVLGMHPTLLPVGRGRAAIPWAILKQLPETGVTLFKLDEGVDTGEIVSQVRIPLHEQIDAATLYKLVGNAHIQLMEKTFPLLESDSIHLIKQDPAKATVWEGRSPGDGEIDLSGSVWDAERLIRAVTRPYPGAFYFKAGQKIIIWKARVVTQQPFSGEHSISFSDGYLECDEWEVD